PDLEAAATELPAQDVAPGVQIQGGVARHQRDSQAAAHVDVAEAGKLLDEPLAGFQDSLPGRKLWGQIAAAGVQVQAGDAQAVLPRQGERLREAVPVDPKLVRL